MAEGQPAGSQAIAAAPAVIYRKDYQPPAYLVEQTDLTFELEPAATRVANRMRLQRNPDVVPAENTLVLRGESLQLKSIAIDGEALEPTAYRINDGELVLHDLPDTFELLVETEINPAENLALEGLYLSDGIFCTQCEAEGFRRISYYLDRPDVMSVFSTRIIADAKRYPVLLSNGNRVGSGVLDDGRHWVQWEDPHKKPCYLFALVAGTLDCIEDRFTTCSGREVQLQIFADSKDLDKCGHAMEALKNAMRWDEEVYGREYDLDLYMIVAVDFFNMGAMENKGLNIFNTSCVLAHPSTQTDAAFQRVEAVIAHEYFHNWSGNRVTCRDWFQLSLKEGFTVFRDACFSADMNSATVKRIEDASLMRSAQFAEDAGPLAHPVRPDSFIEISNFYTLTIYEKGAEVIRMMHRLLGAEAFRRGSDLYFSRHDGQAVTCEDFVVAMEDASNVDLQQFRRWYEQAGTPELRVVDEWDEAGGRYQLRIEQSCPATPGQPDKQPFSIPLDIALLSSDGEMPVEQLLVLGEPVENFEFDGLQGRPVPSLLRGFSAPVKLHYDYSDEQLLCLLRHESDGFVRWDASRRLFLSALLQLRDQLLDEPASSPASLQSLADVLGQALHKGEEDDLALLAEMLTPPDYDFVVEQQQQVDPELLLPAMDRLEQSYAQALGDSLDHAYQQLAGKLAVIGEYRPTAGHIALRSLKNTCLATMLKAPTAARVALAEQQYQQADNMTDQFAALQALVKASGSQAEGSASALLESFYQQWQGESLVVNQWLGLQSGSNREDALASVRRLQRHPAYDATNPNKVRALIGGFCMRSPRAFHAADGSGYQLLAEEVIRLNALNPQLAARLLAPLTRWRRFAAAQADRMQAALRTIQGSQGLSSDVYEVVSKSLD